ncbi:hypothetical protein LZ198_35120 [Myxococcus sp. K15C18031901]|uniref:hypothetical protein n=1 Tax=Myxococcus dinghuensis TaxID=2906761 RepID=UPI0020A71A64|nr:hypothetical protein [Myxococcus dinghuensis]MCP3104115.1 hypothetical protein [Myxococcus dinghuensis]
MARREKRVVPPERSERRAWSRDGRQVLSRPERGGAPPLLSPFWFNLGPVKSTPRRKPAKGTGRVSRKAAARG